MPCFIIQSSTVEMLLIKPLLAANVKDQLSYYSVLPLRFKIGVKSNLETAK